MFATLWAGTSTTGLFAQPWLKELPQYDFIRYDLNRLQFPGDTAGWERVFRKFDRLIYDGEGQVQFLQLGGSHVQAGTWSHEVRTRLQTLAPGTQGGVGFVFPYRSAGTNGPWHYAIEQQGKWLASKNIDRNSAGLTGLAGYAITTTDSAARLRIYFRQDAGPMYDFNKVKVFHLMDSTQFRIHWDHPEDVKKTVTYPGLGVTEFQLAHYRDTLDLHFVKTDSLQQHFTLYGFSLETSDPGFVYHSMGVNGASVPSWLRSDLLGPQIQALQPDVVVFSVGINDANTTDFSPAAYERNYDSLITRIRNVSPNTVFLFTTNTDSYYKRKYPNRNAEKVRDTMIRLAKKYNGAVWDTYGVMGGLGSVKKWQAAGLGQADRVHFTPDGYRLLGDLLSEAIADAYIQHVERRYAGK